MELQSVPANRDIDYDTVGKLHNTCLRHLMDNFDRKTPIDKVIYEAVQTVGHIPKPEMAISCIKSMIKSGQLTRSLDQLGLSDDLLKQIKGYLYVARHGKPTTSMQPRGDKPEKLTHAEAAILDTFDSVFQHSMIFWTEEFESDQPEPQGLVIWTGSHTGVDLGALATADAAGAVGALAGAGLLGLMGVTVVSGPLSPAGVAGYLAVVGAIASFLFWMSGNADVELPREPSTPDGGDDGRGPSV